ncbi:MAG: serine hydrolase [Deltaproteobacteria bacterium]|jgi:CubicO group peptidase (beta-lactamase class C family)|nr:serine hydrolase [Deltaproteobacteria bacterium]MBW2530122.1 serine hydrolase [Deltaproteobacteria bacterium]
MPRNTLSVIAMTLLLAACSEDSSGGSPPSSTSSSSTTTTGSGGDGGSPAAGGGGGGGVAVTPNPCQSYETPFGDWEVGDPADHGFDPDGLDAMWSELESRGTQALLVIRHDAIVYEAYAGSRTRTDPHYTASMAKALVGGTALMVAMHDGRIDPDDLGADHVPQWVGDPDRDAISVRHLATHTSGIEDAEEGGLPHDQLTGWKGDFWARLDPPNDPFSISRDLAPVLFSPGTDEAYSNPGIAMLGYAVTASLAGQPQVDLRSLLSARIMDPIGVPSSEWSCGYGTTFDVDGHALVAAWGGANYSPNATARVGRLMLCRGQWNGQSLIDEAVVLEATKHAGTPAPSGLSWWVNQYGDGSKRSGSLPEDAFWGAGAGNQILLVVPSLEIVLVRNGSQLLSGDFFGGLEQYLFAPLMAALADA